MQPIFIANYPQLQSIIWNRPGATTVDPDEAFALYENNWRFVDKDAMTDNEAKLIEDLKKEIGNGVMYV